MKTKLFLALAIFGASNLISNAQQIIDNDLQVGKDLPTFQTGYGKKLYLSGTHNNTDLMWIARYNRANNQTDFRFNIGDDNSGDDRFVIGNNVSPSTTWRDLFVVSNNGNVGIGTSNPQYKLEVAGKILLGATVNNNSWYSAHIHHIHSLIIGAPSGRYTHNKLELKPGGSNEGQTWSTLEIYRSPKQDEHVRMVSLTAQPGANNYINSGKVGIGTSTPTELLEVAGTIRAREVKVEVNAGADHVFKSDYNLRKLEEVEAFVKENKHLPEIPSEKEMQEKGLSVNDFQIKLLQKIEELTLYTIEQNKRIQQLENALLNK